MAAEYSIEVCKQLEERFARADVLRPLRVVRYEAGTELSYQVRQVGGTAQAQVRLQIERFVGGGFAGQVYRVQVLQVDGDAVPASRSAASGP